MSSSHASTSAPSTFVHRLINGRSRHFNDCMTAVRQCYREMMRRIKNKKTATDEERDIIESHLDFIQNFDYSVRQNPADFPPWALEARDLCLNAAITAFPRSRDTRQGVWDPTVPFPSFTFENVPLYADKAAVPSQNVAVAGSSTAGPAPPRDTTPEHVDETNASSHVTETIAPVEAGDSGATVNPAPLTPPAVPSSPPTPPWSPSKRVRFSSPAPADAGVESSGNSAAIPAPTGDPHPRLVIRIPARPRPAPEPVSGQPEASTSTAGSSAPAIQAPTPVRRSMATLGPPSSEAGPSSAVAPPRATTTTGLTRAEAVASISTIEPVNWRQGRTLVPLIVEDLRESDVQFDFDAPGLEMLTPSPPSYVPGVRHPTSTDLAKADQMSLDPRAFLQQWVRDHRHAADQTVVGRVEEYLRSFERFDIRNFSRALGDFLEDRDIDDPELDLQYPSTDPPAVPTIDATVETIMRGPASPVTESEASAGRDDSPMSIDEFPVRMSIDNSIFAEEPEDDGPEPEAEVAQQPSTDVPAPADTVPESTDLDVEIPPVDSEEPAEPEVSPQPGPSVSSTTVQEDEIVDESGYNWGNLSRYQRKHLESYIKYISGRTLVPLIVEDLRESDVQFDFDAPGLEMLTPSPPSYVPGVRHPTSTDLAKADQMSLDPRAFLQQWVRDHRHAADQTVVGRVEEYLRSFERFDIRNFSRALGDFLEDRDIDDPELDLQYPSTDPPAVPTIDATVETIMRGPASPVTESEASAGRDDSPMSIDEFPVRMSIDNSIFAEEPEDDGPEPEAEVAQQPSTDVPAPADTVPESTDLDVEIPPVDSEEPAEPEVSPQPGPSVSSTTVQEDEIVDESGYNWGNLSRYQRKHLESYIKYISNKRSTSFLTRLYIFIQLFSIDIMSATTGSTGFKSSEWLTKLSEAREQVVAISNMKNAGAILVTAVQAFGDALFERVDFHKFRKVPECVAAYHDHAKTLNGIVDKFNIDKKKLNCLEKINNFSESLRKAQEESKNRGKGKRKRIVSARTVEDSDSEIEIVTAPATGDTDVTMAEPGLAASAHAPKNVKDLPKISKKNAAAGKAGGTTRTIATRASTVLVRFFQELAHGL
ncbi:hypothetical protein K435DRAFT_872164 [Dendrothele bispora CBS 962.96]|uniref:Uncharacterized protein n=1 Tax=Dendrothele bispora (strain CBS 962.96) TaxID=1314807 RepID=A0A4S8L2T5_DENBC|nr:hypothetical protein K435DRAFT_872164 [Dendrothele bispora CBS 962.96]